jgi:hypothetical protein
VARARIWVGTSAISEATAIDAATAPMLERVRLPAGLCRIVVEPVEAICMNSSSPLDEMTRKLPAAELRGSVIGAK